MATAAEPILASSLWTPALAGEAAPSERRLQSNCKPIDTALKGGLDYGGITCITADSESGARDITQALLVSHLLSAEQSETQASATVIDTGQAVDVRRLYQALLADGKADAKAALDRVKLMKTFDFEGLTEAVSELRGSLAGKVPPHEKPPRGTVPDSQDSEDEMLDSLTPPARSPAQTTQKKSNVGLLIIDNITHLAAPLLKANHASGQALITALMRSLAHLTKVHKLCTVVVNGTLSQNYKQTEESPSAFASCTARPALGKTWGYLVDVHLLVQREVAKTAKRGGGEEVSVVEVLQDRYYGRVGRWAGFDVGGDGRVKDAA